MIELQGKFNKAKVFTDNVEETAKSQIVELCNQEFTKDSKIRIMPDTHAGAGCTIGTTMTIADKVVPNIVGVDIGCGMGVTKLDIHKDEINFDQLDEVIRKNIPSGFSVRNEPHFLSEYIPYKNLVAPINEKRARKSLGTLGGGNHFIELNEGSDNSVYLVIHSGSRNLGAQVAKYHQDIAYKAISSQSTERETIISKLKAEGREREIHETLRGIKSPKINKNLAYLEGEQFKSYLNDMEIAQFYALINRITMSSIIVGKMGWDSEKVLEYFDTIHNYIDTHNMVLRKGAISAQHGEKVIIPINMRDGSIIAVGKGNEDWNYSAPHGAGRVMSRTKAKANLSLEEFNKQMNGIWTSSVNESTLDEAPMVYKPINDILDNVHDTIDVVEVVKPIYNFKAN
ncbi:RtcB family protein [Virgibacillus sp. M23]|uniref:RtcB family protein n=1 Tax=Virgibacillus sp. M23 TaxID=3079030 RepID=UPI002A91C589|nr:RtcB family protein [Virgibacillus sp. M23]MDY7043616.1 RtcB family protein [Virgibacillus sp. M23]